MDMTGKKVFITGAAGFIGSHVVDAFLSEGAEVYGLIHYNGHNDVGLLDSATMSHIRFHPVKGDLLDADGIDKAVEGMDIVVHMGAIISIPFSYDNPSLTTQVNVIGTLNILNACLKHKTKRVIVTSTSEVYGSADILPITELTPLKPQSPYAATKIAADALARSYYCSYGLPVVILRAFNNYGPRQSDRAIIPTIICQALSNKETIEVGALAPKRDFVYAVNSAEAFVLAAKAGSEIDGETIHFGTGESYSVAETIELICGMLKIDKKVVVSERRMRPNQSEVAHLLCDSSKAKKLLGWTPKVSFMAGLLETFKYIKAHPERYNPDKYSK